MFGFSLGGSKSSSKSSTNTTTTGTRNLDVAETITRFDEASKQQLDEAVQLLLDKVKAAPEQAKLLEQTFGKDAAVRDSQGAVQDAIRTALQEDIPKILDMQNRSGAYSSTTAQLLADNAQAQAVQKGAAIQLDTVNKYQAILQNARQQDITESGQSLEGLLSALQLERDAVASSNKTEEETGTSTSTSTSKGSSTSISAGISGSYG